MNILLRGSRDAVYVDACRKIAVTSPGGGYILSTACSVSPRTLPENILILKEAVEKFGIYSY